MGTALVSSWAVAFAEAGRSIPAHAIRACWRTIGSSCEAASFASVALAPASANEAMPAIAAVRVAGGNSAVRASFSTNPRWACNFQSPTKRAELWMTTGFVSANKEAMPPVVAGAATLRSRTDSSTARIIALRSASGTLLALPARSSTLPSSAEPPTRASNSQSPGFLSSATV